jgi:hypothetical protein
MKLLDSSCFADFLSKVVISPLTLVVYSKFMSKAYLRTHLFDKSGTNKCLVILFTLSLSLTPQLKIFVWPFEVGGETRLIRSTVKTGGPAGFFENFNDTILREEYKSIYYGFRISGWICPIKLTYRHFSVPGKSI